jgi:hypothetical protein
MGQFDVAHLVYAFVADAISKFLRFVLASLWRYYRARGH